MNCVEAKDERNRKDGDDMRKATFGYLFVVLLTTVSSVSAQEKPRILEKPKKYAQIVDEQDYSVSDDRIIGLRWEVYSNREANETTARPGGGDQKATLGFLEKFYVIGEYENFVRLAKDPAPRYLDLSDNWRDYGWVHKKNLILSGSCLLAEPGKIPRKAMVLNSIAQIKSKRGKPDIVEFKAGPSEDASKTGHVSNLFQFFFVFKTEQLYNEAQKQTENWALLAKVQNVSGGEQDIPRDVVGWVPSERLSLWNHRIAIEPNWVADASNERKSGAKAKIFSESAAAIGYREGRSIPADRVLWDDDQFENRPIGEYRRFPVVSHDKNAPGIRMVGAMGAIYAQGMIGEGANIDPKRIASIQKTLSDLVTYKRNLNVVFVMDGTESMQPYFKAAADAVERCVNVLVEQRRTKNKLKFGAVVYRDYAEKERIAETLPLGDQNKLIPWLKGRDARDYYDKDAPEAVFFGLQRAMRATGISEKETNLIILIGDAGNHHRSDPSQVPEETIIRTLAELDCHFLTFQVNHKSDVAYEEFVSQASSMMLKAAQLKYDQVSARFGSGVVTPPSLKEDGPVEYLENGPLVGLIAGLRRGEQMSAEKLTQEVSASIERMDSYLNTLIAALNIMVAGRGLENIKLETVKTEQMKDTSGTKYASAFASGIFNFLQQSGITREDLELLKRDKYQLYVRGAVTMSVKSQKNEIFKQVLLFQRGEVYVLANYLEQLNVSTSVREDLKKAWLSILKAYLGDLDEKELMQMTVQRAQEMLFGLPGRSEFLRGIRIIDITDESRFTHDMADKYSKRLQDSAAQLRRIVDLPETQYKYSFRSNEQPYYWIDEDIIP